MKVHTINIAFLLASSVTADFLSAKSLDSGENVELGELEDINDFYTLFRHPEGRNGSYEWVDVTEYETLDDEATLGQSVNPSTTTARGLVPREDICTDLTGITKNICDNVPSRYWFWGTGGAILIYYLPRLMETWLNDVAKAVQAGRDLRQVWRDGSTGPNGLAGHNGLKRALPPSLQHEMEVKVRNGPTDYHFSLPYLLDSQGQADASSLHRRSLGEEDGIDTALTHDYVFSEADETLYYKGTNAVFSVGAPDANLQNGTSVLRKRATTDYTIVMSIVRRTSATTKAKPSCLAKLLRYHIDRSSEKNRFACRPIDNRGSWHATMHLMINHGKNNQGKYGYCC
ncbi:conserved hypothetical protein [Aspergillus terreus NIH2624]|uniref:Uncharacterized protein n=1 Tax=Aspergillus terreus (strain NIH 2624 / FGSC A1156) TaxID=341663 RepID=Q0CFD3_ASPTN|nr:uncharacterized protein ATEG_07601 [Aspergillus terreus NIH2624]EAU31863.1 conserved hypothetical protein [Aspergillus terreus NIH2624]